MGIVSVFVVLAVVTLVLGVLVVRRRPPGAIAGVGRELVGDVPATTVATALLERWRDRARRWRMAVAAPALVASLGANLLLRQSVDVGVGAHPAWADPLLTGLLGAFLGAMAAEAHHLRPRSGGRRTVDLTPRDPAAYRPRHSRRRLVWLGAAAAATTIAVPVVGDGTVPTLGVLALCLGVAVPAAQRGIVTRARPAVTQDLRAADDAVRRLAVRSVDEAGAGAMLLLVAWQLAPVYTSVQAPQPLTAVMAVAQLAAVVLAIVWWRRSNPDRLLPDVPAALARAPDHHALST